MNDTCTQCGVPAAVTFRWPTSKGPAEAPLCTPHAAARQRAYANTPAGLELTIAPISYAQIFPSEPPLDSLDPDWLPSDLNPFFDGR